MLRCRPFRSLGPRAPLRALVLSALLAILMCTSACGGLGAGTAPSRDPTPGVAIQSGIVVRSASVRVLPWAPRTGVSASCHPGEELIGGGFTSSDTFEYAATIVASYPANATTWTVAAAAGPAFILSAEAYCVPAGVELGLIIVHTLVAPAGAATCATGSVLLSGGFQSDGPVTVSRPDGNGWYASATRSTGQVLALCASLHVRAGDIVSASLDPHSSSRGQLPDGATLPCSSGQTATAGGFSGGGLVIVNASAGVPYDSWNITAGGDGALTLYARCVTFTA